MTGRIQRRRAGETASINSRAVGGRRWSTVRSDLRYSEEAECGKDVGWSLVSNAASGSRVHAYSEGQSSRGVVSWKMMPDL